MMVGYSVNHSDGVYRMWNPSSNRILISRDVVWLKRMYFQPETKEREIHVNNDDADNKVRESDNNNAAMTSDDDIDVKSKSSDNDNDSKEHLLRFEEINKEKEENNNQKPNEAYDGEWQKFTQTRSGRVVQPIQCYDDLAAMALTKAEFDYQVNL